MATSGTLTTTKFEGRYYELSWSATQSIGGNYSTVNWSLEAKGGSSGWYVERAVLVNIDGVDVYYKDNAVNRYTGVVATGSKTIYHNPDGTKSFSATVKAQTYYSSYNNTGSATWTLDSIPREATITSYPDTFTDETNQLTIGYSNVAGNNVDALHTCIAIWNEENGWWADSGAAYREISRTGTSYTYNLTEAEKVALRRAVKTGNSLTVKFYLRTTIDDEYYYNTKDTVLTLVNYTPTLNPTIKDVGTVSTRLTGNNQVMIKGYNVISYNIGAAGRKEATIQNQRITCGNQTSTEPTGTLGYVTSNLFEFRAYDSRGNITETSKELTMIDYKPLTCRSTATIELDGEETSKIEFSIVGDFWSGNFGAVTNSLTLKYRIKEVSEEWATLEPMINTTKGTYSFDGSVGGLDYKKTYTLEVVAYDAIYNGAEGYNGVFANPIQLNTIPVFDWGENDFNFNVPVVVNGDLLVKGSVLGADGEEDCPSIDYPVEQGTKNGWGYRKWNSGFAECWYTASVSGIDVGEYNLDGMYYCGSKGVSFPFTFTSIEYVNASGGSTGNMNFVRPFNHTNSNMTYIVMGMSDKSNVTIRVNLEAKGRWK